MPRLSVLLPVRNGEATIAAAVRSVLRALPRDAGLVVLDDASSDTTAAILRTLADPRLTVLSSTGIGIAHGLNLLLEKTDSEYVARMDGDDIALPWRFAMQARALRHAGADVTFSTVAMLRSRRLRPTGPIAIPPRAFALHLLVTNPVAHPAMYARRAGIDRVGGYRNVPSEDYDLWLRMALAGVPLHKSAAPGLLYRIHDQQITASQQWRRASWSDPYIQRSYRELSQHLLGVDLPRLLSVASDPRKSYDEVESHIATLTGALARHTRNLPRRDRWYLNRTIAVRVAHARAVAARAARSDQ